MAERSRFIALTSAGVCTLIAVVIGASVTYADGPIWFDRAITQWAVEHRSAALDGFFKVVTKLGYGVWPTVVMVVMVVVTIVWRRSALALVMISSSIFAMTVGPILKDLVGRSRPDQSLWLVRVASPSFPSGHAIGSITAWAAAASVLILMIDRRGTRLLIGVLTTLLVVLIGFSRIYLGVHWATDVIAGWAMASAWLLIVLVFVHRSGGGPMTLDEPQPDRSDDQQRSMNSPVAQVDGPHVDDLGVEGDPPVVVT